MKEKILFRCSGSGILGYNYFLSIHASWPLSKIEVYSDKIVFKLWPFERILNFNKIKSIEKWSTINFFKGIKIIHKEKCLPYIVFFPCKYYELFGNKESYSKLLKELKKHHIKYID